MKYIYAVCLLALVPVTASAAEPKWSFKKANRRSNGRDFAVVVWPNPQYRGQLNIQVDCRSAGSEGLAVVIDTSEHLGTLFDAMQVPIESAGNKVVMEMTALSSKLLPSGYENRVRFIDALLSPPLSIAISDVNGRPVVATSVPTEGAETALRKLTCLSRYFYEYDQRPENRPVPSSVCGNGNIEIGEVCDDGNQAGNDGCEPDCTLPVRRPNSTP